LFRIQVQLVVATSGARRSTKRPDYFSSPCTRSKPVGSVDGGVRGCGGGFVGPDGVTGPEDIPTAGDFIVLAPRASGICFIELARPASGNCLPQATKTGLARRTLVEEVCGEVTGTVGWVGAQVGSGPWRAGKIEVVRAHLPEGHDFVGLAREPEEQWQARWNAFRSREGHSEWQGRQARGGDKATTALPCSVFVPSEATLGSLQPPLLATLTPTSRSEQQGFAWLTRWCAHDAWSL